MKIIPFADHTIGYRCLELLLEKESKAAFSVPFIVTTESNDSGWWPKISELAALYHKELFVFESLDHEMLKQAAADYFFLISWKYIVSEAFREMAPGGVINLHYSLLPEYRGVYPVNWAIIEGNTQTGITFHWVDGHIDHGNIICQESIEIGINDTAFSLINKLDDLAYKTFSKMIMDLDNTIQASQSGSIQNNVYYSREKFAGVSKIDLDTKGTFKDFYNLIRGLSFLEEDKLAYIEENGKKFFLFLAIKAEE